MDTRHEIKKLKQSFRHAGIGFLYCINNERNMRIHLSVFVILSVFAKVYRLTKQEYLFFVLVCGLVIFAEMVNTAVEAIVNLLSPSYQRLAKVAKDVSAGAVLLTALLAIVVGIGLFFDMERLRAAWLLLLEHPILIALFVILLLLAWLFVFMGNGIVSKIDAGKKK